MWRRERFVSYASRQGSVFSLDHGAIPVNFAKEQFVPNVAQG